MEVMETNYNASLVAMSFAVAIFASFVALDLVGSVSKAVGRAKAMWLTAGALAMGSGIWSMHFIGMLAFEMPGMPMSYDLKLMILSVIVAVIASGFALSIMSRSSVSPMALTASSLAMAVAIAGMHYIGMYSMRMPAVIEWNYALVAASFFIALAASFRGDHHRDSAPDGQNSAPTSGRRERRHGGCDRGHALHWHAGRNVSTFRRRVRSARFAFSVERTHLSRRRLDAFNSGVSVDEFIH